MNPSRICRACSSRRLDHLTLPHSTNRPLAVLSRPFSSPSLPILARSKPTSHHAVRSARSNDLAGSDESGDDYKKSGSGLGAENTGDVEGAEDMEDVKDPIQREEEDESELYDADELESRLASLSRVQKFRAASEALSNRSRRPSDTSEAEYGEGDNYSFDLEEPELDPRMSYGLRRPGQVSKPQTTAEPKVRAAYPTLIKLRPDLDPETEAEELEMRRRDGQIRRQAAAKRSAKGDFQDHIRVRVRGGRGGSGAASFDRTLDGRLGAPAGGNGGPGGSVYVQAVPHLTSLHTLARRFLADQGRNGGRELRNGQAGDDLIITVPVGTVVTEISREGDEEAQWARMEQMEIDMEDRKWDRWERWFQITNSNPFESSYYAAAERLLRRERKWATRTPTFEEKPPVRLDLDKPTPEPILIASGGTGGMGNPFFAGIVGHRQPRFSSRGLIPYTSVFELELKILADVGLVGFPNAGKSTILRALTGRRAEVAGYQFTTLNPQVGVVRVWDDGTWNTGSGSNVGETGVVEESWKEKARDTGRREQGNYAPLQRAPRVRDFRSVDKSENLDPEKIEAYRFTISDNPGLLPQASENVGLGHSFLRSIERSLALAYVLDITRPDPAADYKGLKEELEAYQAGLSEKAAVVVLNKGDEEDPEKGRKKMDDVKAMLKDLGQDGRVQVVVISGKFGLGLDKLVRILGGRVEEVRAEQRLKEEEA